MKAVVCNGCRTIVERFEPGSEVPAGGLIYSNIKGPMGHLCSACAETVRIQIGILSKEDSHA